ncbi:twin transmembrane helix small protein [Legionella maioricensis]|uniref:Twin transmembrane helix small protein n=1 Tax=Legionella maioricensis TaxID=2896528 RepID=A0A9X2CYZ0_9GAMM|nr:twin transmembrane helix small protein [Legionella maioricensis]MCL9683282.1 twin transmembrane helix small protein [Legionella maioricensis]MCL9686022.1 twin transmembrane helix small protein [Legionella maioricensis]
MITKLFIIFIMIIIAGSLASGLFFLVRDSGNSKRTVKALTIRITISLTLFIFLLVAFKFGLIKPHGI